jgi:hypothetical protein
MIQIYTDVYLNQPIKVLYDWVVSLSTCKLITEMVEANPSGVLFVTSQCWVPAFL